MTDQAQSIIEEKKKNRNPTSVHYPEDIGDFYVCIDFYKYRTAFGDNSSPVADPSKTDMLRRLYNADKQSVNNQIMKSTFARIKLPIPQGLVDSFAVNYATTELGGGIGALASGLAAAGSGGQALAGIASNLITGGDASVAAESEEFKKFMNAAGTGAARSTATGIGKYLTSKLGISGVESVAGLVDLVSGDAINPNITVLFRGPTLKSHNFSWHITPRSRQESANIQKIIGIVKRAMHPEQFDKGVSVLLKYPSECLIQFVGKQGNKQFLYPLRPTVVESLSVNYAPSNVPSFFQDTHEVTSLDLNIRFQETSYYTRESFDDTSEYGSDGIDVGYVPNTTQGPN